MTAGAADPILPGASLGVLGGGQLGRMFAVAARRMGYGVTVFAPESEVPAAHVADRHVRAAYDDLDAVAEFARSVAAVTFEFENVPSPTAEAAARHAPVRPAGSLLHTTQERSREKSALSAAGIPVAPFALIQSDDEVAAAQGHVGLPAVWKSASWGYDGRGQQKIDTAADLEQAVAEIGVPAVMEGFISFIAELSVVGVRGVDGQIALYDPVLNKHRDHILDVTLCPAPVPEMVREDALELARAVLQKFEVVGVLCVEMFLLDDGSLLVNELAPRPHNSGHITLDAHACCQFEQQVRALCALPLGSTERVVPAAAMINLLGDVWANGVPDVAAALSDSGVHLHLYGKTEARPKRKMGHLNVADTTVEAAEQRGLVARNALARRV